jgi:hypothetical protein
VPCCELDRESRAWIRPQASETPRPILPMANFSTVT